MKDIDPLMKKVFKHEFKLLEEFERTEKNLNSTSLYLSEDELRQNYKKLLESYQSLLKHAMKITSIGDMNQKKLFDAFEELERQKAALYQTSIMDQLTEVHNRTYIMSVFDDAFAHTKRYQQAFSCILLDIDDFKKINDTHGHQAGDAVLKATAQQIAGQLRETDFIGRYGGEEFLIILTHTNATEADKVAEKVRAAVAELKVGEQALCVTISLGVCDTDIDNSISSDALLHKVDIALYHAKDNGKNRAVIYHEALLKK